MLPKLNKDRDDYPKVMHRIIDGWLANAKSIEAIEAHVHVALAFKGKFKDCFTQCSVDMWGYDGVGISVVTDDMTSILPPLRWLRQKGYRCHTHKDTPTTRSRFWIFNHIDTGKDRAWTLKVEATLATDSVKCEYVQVGVREEPIMALRCDGVIPTGELPLDIPTDLK